MTAVAIGTILGLVVADTAQRHLPHAAPWRSWTLPALSTRVTAVAAFLGLLVLAPPAAPLVPLGWWTRRRVRARRVERATARRVRGALPDLVDLLVLTSSAGLSLPVAHPLVAASTPAPVGPALAAAHEAATMGRPRADAVLAALAPMGERARALAHVLVDHLRYGVPLLPGLERAGLELRLDRRRWAELEARRVPVRLLAPLVTCVLPAFALLTVIPLLAASLDALPT